MVLNVFGAGEGKKSIAFMLSNDILWVRTALQLERNFGWLWQLQNIGGQREFRR